MAPDPHAETGGAYTTATLYLDTPGLDVLHRIPSYRRRKFRIRRYGGAPWVSLERKTRSGDCVRKRRSPLDEGELGLLAAPDSSPEWPGRWFHRRILARDLFPSALVMYTRTAYCAQTPEGPMRLTIDRDIWGRLADGWRPAPFTDGRMLLPGRAILELKFLDAMPAPFRALVASMGLAPASISKYRVCREAWADTAHTPAAHHAPIGAPRA